MEKELDIVAAGYIVHEGKILLIHHRKLNKWLPVGGHIEKNETPCEALRREIREEVGLEIDFLQYPEPRRGNSLEYPLPFYVNRHHIKDSHQHYCLFYLCKPKSKEVHIEESELINYSWLLPNELSSLNPPMNDGDLTTCLEAINLASKLA